MESKPKLPLAGISTNTFNNSKINSSTPIPKQNAKERMRRLQAICRKGQDPLSTIKKEITIKSEGKCETRKRKVQHIDTPLGKRFACAQFGGVNQRLTQWMREGTRIIVKLRAFAPGRAQQRGPNRMLQGAIVAFDKHWNLILRDVDEAYFPSLRLGKVQAMPRAMPKSIRYEIEGNAKKGRQILIRHLKCSFITGSSIVMIHEG
ncbi:hypothetical protein ACQ4LE_008589 [Meloidogyne hapla]|uniref:Sm domain-containing protein n=1 Tax=Meloidogyne hapla TaxID=6305 RepID=A0A1I8AXI0_MELHA